MDVNTNMSPHAGWFAAGQKRTLGANMLLVLGATALITLSAKISVPFYPVPMTLQSLTVILVGVTLGPRLGGLALAAYLLEGIVGLPVFAGTPEKGIGLAYMAGPTGGYLAGFLMAAVLAGHLARMEWGRSWISAALVMLVGAVAIYVPGLLWLGVTAGWDKPILAWGLYPFLLGEALKLAIGTIAIRQLLRSARAI